MKKLLLFLVILNLFQHLSFSQDQHLVDSLESQLKNYNAIKTEMQIKTPSPYDTTAANILYQLSKTYLGNNPDKAMDYTKQVLALSEQIGFKKGIGNAYYSMGVVTNFKNDYLSALEFYRKSLKQFEEIDDKKDVANSLNKIGTIYINQGNYPQALKNCFAALKIFEEIKDKSGMAASYKSIGLIYNEQGNFAEAMKNYTTSLRIYEEAGDKNGIAKCYLNIGYLYDNQNNYSEALKNYFAYLKIVEELKDKQGIAGSYLQIGTVYTKQGNYSEALKIEFAALKIFEETERRSDISSSYGNIAEIFTKQKKYNDAFQYLNKGLSIAKENGSLRNIVLFYQDLATLDSAQGNYKQALVDYKLFVATHDSLENNESTKKITQQQMQFDFDKKQVADSLRFAQEKEIETIKLQKQKAYTYCGLFGIAITIVLMFFVYRNYSKQRIANQKLKETQEQLIKNEKMAAFGVMASRVSHEIQNPLNFVNNFSELAQEMVLDVIKSQNEEDKMQLADILISNLQKINEHGKRAATIIIQLQEHSRKGSAHEFFEER